MKAQNIILVIGIGLAGTALGYFWGNRTPETVPESTMEMAMETEGTQVLYWRAPMDPTEMYDEPGQSLMGMTLVPVYAEEEVDQGSRVAINPVVAQNMGIRYSTAVRTDLFRSIRTVGEVMVDEERVYQVNARISGWIEKLHVSFDGAPVKKGDPLLEIYSPELVSTQEEFLLALGHLDDLLALEGSLGLDAARRMVKASRNRMENWDIPTETIDHIQHSREVQRTVLLRSPATGVVLEKHAIEGAFVAEGSDLYRIADLRTVWIHASFYDFELPWISEGQRAQVELSYLPGKLIEGEVSYVYPFLREKARDIHVRIIVPNAGLEMKPGMYANVALAGKTLPNVVAVPSEAIIRSGERTLVFVAQGDGEFEPREVKLGAIGGPDNDLVHIISGLEAGDRVVTSAQFLIDSESRLQEAIQKMRAPQSQSDTMSTMESESDSAMPSNQMDHDHD
ncbi:MAG: efflux RND transporter periplasmic adaptor subunit [Bacteroidetes Order II. Incertae sedis bacterium]|nr:efflux RND transporter periplasmic adaptor subunit [Bacteroidetes Order II. bacterium]